MFPVKYSGLPSFRAGSGYFMSSYLAGNGLAAAAISFFLTESLSSFILG